MEPMNPVPAGALEKEVADDVDVKVSEGEFIIPANVVRFYGTDKFIKMIQKAEEMISQDEKLGGDPDALPFSPEELQAQDMPEDKPAFAAGGLVAPGSVAKYQDGQGRSMYAPSDDLEANKQPFLPLPAQNAMGNFQNKGQSSNDKGPSTDRVNPMAGSVDKWGYDDFAKYEKQINDPASKVIGGIIGNLPMGGLFQKMRQTYLDKAVPENISRMLETGKDNLGNPLTDDQKNQLRTTQASIATKVAEKGTVGGGLGGMLTGGISEALGSLFSKKEEKAQETDTTEASTSSDSGATTSTSTVGRDFGAPKTYDPSTGRTVSEDEPSGMYKGGLITKRRLKK